MVTFVNSEIPDDFLFDLILNVPVNNFSVMSGWVFLGWTSTKQGLMCLAQGHKAVPSVRLEPATPRSWVKHSTTEPLRSKIPDEMQQYAAFQQDCFTPGRRQSKTSILSMNVDQKSIETVFSIAICCHTGDKWQSKNTVSIDFWSMFFDCW